MDVIKTRRYIHPFLLSKCFMWFSNFTICIQLLLQAFLFPVKISREKSISMSFNARVTLVIWILDTIGNISIVIVWVAIHGRTTFGTLTNSMLWYYLILPYCFLMNTSYHKSRIVDNGWKSVILNCVAAPYYFVFPQRRTPNSQRPHISMLPSLTTEQNTNTHNGTK